MYPPKIGSIIYDWFRYRSPSADIDGLKLKSPDNSPNFPLKPSCALTNDAEATLAFYAERAMQPNMKFHMCCYAKDFDNFLQGRLHEPAQVFLYWRHDPYTI